MKCDVLCNSVRAVFVVYCSHNLSVGWRFLLQATETCPNSAKITSRQGLENAETSWVWSHVDDDDEASCRFARDPDEDVCRFHRDCL